MNRVGGGEEQRVVIAQGIGGMVGAIAGFAFAAVVIIGIMKMKNLQSYGMAMASAIMASAIMAMLSSISRGCCLGPSIGIWAIDTLN